MDCLDGLVGIRGICTPETPDSIFYVNDLPSISIKEVDASLNSESASAVELIRQKIELAGDLIAARMRTYFNPRFKGNSLIENGVIGFAKDNQETVNDQTGYLIGKEIEITNYNYLEFFLSKVGLHCTTSGSKNVFVYDLIQNKLLDTIPVTTVAGEISYVDVYKSYKSYGQKIHLFIGYEYTGSYKTILSRNNCSSCKGQVYQNPYVRFANRSILTSDVKIADNLVTGSEDGLTMTYSVNCTFDPFVCSMKHLLAEAICWKSGELLAMEMRYSKRNNSIISVYTEDYDALIAGYAAGAEAALKTNLQTMRLPDSECFYCNKKAFMETRI